MLTDAVTGAKELLSLRWVLISAIAKGIHEYLSNK